MMGQPAQSVGEDMSDTAFFIRSKGRITGPYDLPSLQRMVRRRLVSRFDEVSSDRRSWSTAGEYEDLFPADAAASAVADSVPTGSGANYREQSEPFVAPHTVRFFYSQSGSTVGPVPVGVL